MFGIFQHMLLVYFSKPYFNMLKDFTLLNKQKLCLLYTIAYTGHDHPGCETQSIRQLLNLVMSILWA